MATTFTWVGGGSDWQNPASWTAPGNLSGPPGPDDIAQVQTPVDITGTGAAAQFQTTNGSGSVALDGNFNIGTIFNGNVLTLEGSITSQFIESFVSLDIVGAVSAIADLDVPDNGILQGNGQVVIQNGGTVDASSYTLNYNPGSLDQPNHSSLLIDGENGGAWLTIATPATIDADTDQIVGGFGILTAATVDVLNGGSLYTTYLSIESSGATLTVDDSTIQVTQTSNDPDGVAGINMSAGTLDIQNNAHLDATFYYQDGDDTAFVIDHSTATIAAADDTINGIDVLDGIVSFINEATVTASQLHLGASLTGTSDPLLTISDSSLEITGTGIVAGLSFSGLWLADGATDVTDASHVTTPEFELDSPAVADPANELGAGVTIDGGSTVSVSGDVILGVTDDSSVELVVTGTATLLQWGDQLIVGDGSGDGDGATAFLSILAGAEISTTGTADGQGVFVVGGNNGDTGDVEIADEGSKLTAIDATVGDGGNGTLFATDGGSIDISGTLNLGLNDGSFGTLQVAGQDGPADAMVGTLDVGDYGTGMVLFTSQNGLNSGTLTVSGDVYVGVFDGSQGTIFAGGGSFTIDGDFIVGDEGEAFVGLDSSILDVQGDIVIGNGGTAAFMGLQDVDLTLGGTLYVGEAGNGVLDWGSTSDQATSLDTVVIGDQSGADGLFVLHDPTTALTIGTLAVGNTGTGTLDVFNGATIEVTDQAGIGVAEDSVGKVVLQAGTDDIGADYPNAGSAIVFDEDVYVGDAGDGGLFIGSDADNDGASAAIHGDLVIGDEATAFGTVVVQNGFVAPDGTFTPSVLTVDQDIFVGVSAAGTVGLDGTLDVGAVLAAYNGATIDATADGYGVVDVAQEEGSSGSIDIDNSLLSANTLLVGDGGDGWMGIVNGVVNISGDIVVGDSATATGTIDIESDALLQSDGDLIIGGGATAITSDPGTIEYPSVLYAADGAEVQNNGTGDDGFFIGYDLNSLGEAIIDGATLDVNAATIGVDGSGVLQIVNGATATFNDDLVLGDGTASFGGMDVEASDVDFYGTLIVGASATGATVDGVLIPGGLLTIGDGSTLLEQGFDGVGIAADPGSTGLMIVDDAEAEVSFIVVGDGGTGTLTVENGGTFSVDPDQDVEIGSEPGSSGTIFVDNSGLSFGAELVVGAGGDGSLFITNGGIVTPGAEDDTDVTIGDEKTSNGTIGLDDSLLLTDDINIGEAGTGWLIIRDGGTVETDGDAVIGAEGSGVGTATLIGLGGTIDDTLWQIDGQLTVGDLGAGTLDVSDGATLTVGDEFDIGNSSEVVGDTGTGVVTLSGFASVIEADGDLFIGGDGSGTVAVSDLAQFTAGGDVTLGDGIGASGSLIISGATFTVNGGDVTIGNQGSGVVTVNGGGDFNAGTSSVDLGETDLGKGTLRLTTDGVGYATAETGDLTIGEEGTGSVTVGGNDLLTTNGDAVIGDTGDGYVTIDGSGAVGTLDPATWTIVGDLSIAGLTTAGGGLGRLTVLNGGIVQIAGEAVMWNLGTIIDNGGTPGLIEIGGTTLTSGSGIVIDAATTSSAMGTLSGGGTIMADIVDDGLVDLTNTQTLIIDGSVTGNGTLLLDGASVLEVTGAIASGVSIVFDSGPGQVDILQLTTPLEVLGTIYNLGSGDAIDLPGVSFAGTGIDVFDGVMTITQSGLTVASLALNGDYATSDFSLVKDGSGDADIVFGNPPPPVGAPVLTLPAELPAWPTSYQEYLTGTAGIYVADPNAPVNSTYTVTVNDTTGTLFLLPQIANTQTDTAGSHPIVFIGSLDEINADLGNLIYESSGSAFSNSPASPDTITVGLTRGDGVTETGAIGYDPPKPAPSMIDAGSTTIPLGQPLALSLIPADSFAAYDGDNDFSVSINTTSNTGSSPYNGYLLFDGQVTSNSSYSPPLASLADVAGALGNGNLLFIPTRTGVATIDGRLSEQTGASISTSTAFSFQVTVTAATRNSGVIDTWTAAAAAVLSGAGNWSRGFEPGTLDTAVFTPITDVPLIATTGDGVAALWDLDAPVSFTGVVDASGKSRGGVAADIDQGATVSLLPGASLFVANAFEGSGFWYGGNFNGTVGYSGNQLIVGDTAPAVLNATDADLYTGETTIGNSAAAGGSRVTVMDSYWAPLAYYSGGNTGNILVGNNGFGELDLINSRVNNTDIRNFEGTGFGQIQIGQDNPGSAGSGGLGVFYNSVIEDSVQVGDFGSGELAMSGGYIGAYNLQYVSLAVWGGRVDWGGGASLDITNGLAGDSDATLGYGVIAGDDWSINGDQFGHLTNGGTIEAAAGLPSTIDSVQIEGNGTLLIDAGGTLNLIGHAEPVFVGSGQDVVFRPEFNNAGGLLSIGNPNVFAGTIVGFADGDRIELESATPVTVASATYDAGHDITRVVFNVSDGYTTTTIAFAGSIAAGNFALDPTQPSGNASMLDYVEAGTRDQAPILSGPTDIDATDGVANLIPGLSLSDQDAARDNQRIQLTLSSLTPPGGTFSAPAATGLSITGDDTGRLTLSGNLAVIQAELASITYTPDAGQDDYLGVTAFDGVTEAAPLLILAHNSSYATGQAFTGTGNYVYAGGADGSFDQAGAWQDGSGNQYPSAPNIADSATIVANTLQGGQDAIGGIGVAGQLLTEGLVVLTGTLTLGGLDGDGIGTIDGTGPAFTGALEDAQGNLVFGSASRLSLGGDLIVDGELDDMSDNAWSVAGDIDINGGTLALGGLGAVTVTGTVEIAGTIANGVTTGGQLDIIGDFAEPIYIGAGGSAVNVLSSAAGLIGMGAGTSTVTVGGSVTAGWSIAGALIVGDTGDATMFIQGGSGTIASTVSAATVTIGAVESVAGTVSVLNLSSLVAASTLIVGGAGDGILDVTVQNPNAVPDSGVGGNVLVGSVAAPGELDIGAADGGVGIVHIAMPGTVTVDGSAYLGGTSAGASGGTGTVTVSGDSFQDSNDGAGLFDVTGAFVAYSGTVLLREGTAAFGSLTIDAGATVTGDGFVSGPGVPTGNFTNPAFFTAAAPLTSIVDDGLIDATVDAGDGSGLLSLYGAISGDGTLEVGAGATLAVEGTVAPTVHVTFDGTGGVLILSRPASFASVIDGFQAGDMLRLPGVAPGVVAYDQSSGVLTDTVGDTVYTFTFDPPSGAFSAVSDTHDGTLLELATTPTITAPAAATVGVGKSTAIAGVSLAGTSDETGDTFSVTLSDAHGLLAATGAGVTDSNSTSLTISGTQSSIDDALATLTDTDAVTPSDTITVSAEDLTQSVFAPSATIAVTVNGLPVIAVPAAQTFFAGSAQAISGIGVSETGDTGSEVFTVTLHDTTGALAVTADGANVTGSGGDAVQISGSLTDVNDALASLTDTAASAGTDTITVNASDSFGNIATTETIGVTTETPPGPPVLGVPSELYLGQSKSGAPGITLTEDNIAAGETFDVSLQDQYGQLFYLLPNFTSGGVGPSGAVGTSISLSGSLGLVQEQLASLTDTVYIVGDDTIGVTVTDSFGGSVTATIPVMVAGDLGIEYTPDVTVSVGQATAIPGTTLSEMNASPSETYTFVLADTDGVLSANTGAAGGGGSIVASGGGTTLTIAGTLAEINADLTTLADDDTSTGSDMITLDATDQFGIQALEGTIDVNVADTPVIGVPGNQTIGVNQATVIGGIGVSETGAPIDQSFTVTVADSDGLLSIGDDSGATVTGSGGATVSVSGTADEVNNALATLSDDDATAGTDTIVVNGSDGSGNVANQATVGVTVNGLPSIDAPASVSVTRNEASPIADVVVSETGDTTDSGETFTIVLSDIDGVLAANTGAAGGGGDITQSGGGTTLTIAGTLVEVNADLTTLTDDDPVTAGDTIVVGASDSLGNVATQATIAVGVTVQSGGLSIEAPGSVTIGVGRSMAVGGVELLETPIANGETFTAILSDTNGVLSATTNAVNGGGTITPADGGTSLTISGSFAQVNADLTTLTDDDGTPGSDSIILTASDSDGGLAQAATIDVTVNGLPVLAAPSNLALRQNDPAAIGDVGLSETGDTADESFTVTVADSNGMLSTSDAGGATIGGANSNHLVVSGSLSAVNTALANLDIVDGTPGSDTITLNATDGFGNTAVTATIGVTVGQSFVLTTGADTIAGGVGDDLIVAGSNTLSSGDHIDGGGGTNTLDLTTAGSFNLALPSTLTNVQVVDAQEGQAAYAGAQSFGASNQIVTLRAGLNVTVDVTSALINPLNPKPATITIIGANDASVINLAGGNDVVTVGSAAETVHGGSGDDQIQVTANTIGAAIDGGTGHSTLDVLGGGSVVMGASVTDIAAVLLASTPNAMSFIANGISGLVVDDAGKGGDSIAAGGLDQTLTGGAGQDLFTGFGGGATTFQDSAAAFNGDTISGFLAAGDQIVFTDVSFANLTKGFVENGGGTAGLLTVSDGSHSAAVTLNGSFTAADFHATPLGGGTAITYGQQT